MSKHSNKGRSAHFEITPELEKAYRENQVMPNLELVEKLGIESKIYADYIQLALKHPEYFSSPKEAKEAVEYIFKNPKIALRASKQEYKMIISPLDDKYGAVVLDTRKRGGKHRVQSAHFIKQAQLEAKIKRLQSEGEPILQFSYVNP